MGGVLWRHFVPFEEDVRAALESLRAREFAAGRYEMVDDPDVPASSIEDALYRSGATGTRSVLDMAGGISTTPRDGCVSPLSRERLIKLFGTTTPTRELVERSLRPRAWVERGTWLPEHIDRGRGIYVVVYRNGEPAECFFAGYSFD
jgi:hypothetical protein